MANALSAQGIALSPDVLRLLRDYGQLVAERSQLLNLVGPADRGRIYTRHVAECLHGALLEMCRRAGSLVDVGSGAGLPGIPLALASPDLRAVLVEPRLRKAQFLETAVARLGLADRVSIFQGTAESLGRTSERFGLATARAVGRIPVVWQMARPLLTPGGWLALFKGPEEVGPELDQIEEPGPARHEVSALPGNQRVVVFLQAPEEG